MSFALEILREGILLKIGAFNFDALAEDISPFLISKEQAERLVKFRELEAKAIGLTQER